MVGGLQRLRMDQLSSDLPMSPGLGHRAFSSRRRTARHITEVHSSTVNLSSAFHGGYAQVREVDGGVIQVSAAQTGLDGIRHSRIH